jgi:hypothetical protein
MPWPEVGCWGETGRARVLAGRPQAPTCWRWLASTPWLTSKHVPSGQVGLPRPGSRGAHGGPSSSPHRPQRTPPSRGFRGGLGSLGKRRRVPNPSLREQRADAPPTSPPPATHSPALLPAHRPSPFGARHHPLHQGPDGRPRAPTSEPRHHRLWRQQHRCETVRYAEASSAGSPSVPRGGTGQGGTRPAGDLGAGRGRCGGSPEVDLAGARGSCDGAWRGPRTLLWGPHPGKQAVPFGARWLGLTGHGWFSRGQESHWHSAPGAGHQGPPLRSYLRGVSTSGWEV